MHKKLLLPILALALALPLVSCGDGEGKESGSASVSEEEGYTIAQVYETTGSRSRLFQRTSDIELTPYEYLGHSEVVVGDEPIAPYHGNGGALTHSSAYLLSQLDEELRHEILESLYGESGAHFSLVRVPWGTSDYTLSEEDFYTFDDVDGSKDYTLEHFSIAKDERFLIPVLREIVEINPDVEIIAAPWSAPAWMKTSGNLVGGRLIGSDNQELENPSNEEKAYAQYLFKAVEAYAEAGVPVDYLSIVNEPLVGFVQYPCMMMDSAQQYRVAKLLGEYLSESDYEAKILGYDHNVGSALDLTFDSYAAVLADGDALSGALGGFAVHCYDGNWPNVYGDFIYETKQNPAYGEYPVFVTEVTESSSSVDFAQNLSWSADNVAIGPAGQGYSGSTYWNLVLDPNGKPVKGNSATCYGIITLDPDGSYSFSASYYAMLHLSKFSHIEDGEMPQWVSSESTNFGTIVTAAMKNQDGTTTVAIVNTSDRVEEAVDVVVGDKMASVTVQPQSVTTLLLTDGEGEPYEAIELDGVTLTQTSYGVFDVEIETAAGEGVSFHLAEGMMADEEDPLLDLAYEDGVYKGVLEAMPGEHALHMVKGDVEGDLSITIPRANPSIVEMEGGYIQANFTLDTGMSWSSFCDPYGKEVWRSSEPVFDEKAEKVNLTAEGEDDPIYITTNEYIDKAPDVEKPYYFIRLIGKNGLVDYRSAAIRFREDFFEVAEDKIELLMVEGVPTFRYEGKVTSELGLGSAIYVKDINNEEHVSSEAIDLGENRIRIDFDLRVLEKRGTWYDLFLLGPGGSASFEFTTDDAPDYSATIESEGVQYKFENWEGVVKINAIAL